MKQTLLSHDGQVRQVARTVLLMSFLTLNYSAFAQLAATVNSTTHATCYGSSTGAIDIDVWGGMPPYTYAWSHGPTSEDVLGLAAGTYSVIVTDALADTATATATVSQPSQLSVLKLVKSVECNGGNDGSINLVVSGGSAPYSYYWSTGDTTANITDRPSGYYSVTVTDNQGCSTSAFAIIGEPSELMLINTAITDVSCHGGSDASISLMPVGGMMPYSFTWSNGATTKDVSGIAAGTYSVIATDNNGCTAYDTITITEPAQPLSATASVTNSTCYFSADGSIDISVSGGTEPYSYMWNTAEVAEDLTGVPVGSYSVTVTDNNGCVLNLSSDVQAMDSIPPTALCQNIDLYLDASGKAAITASDLDSASFDNCSIDTITLSKYSFECSEIGTNSVDFIVHDSNGNIDTCSSTINVVDTVRPMIAVQNITLYLDSLGNAAVEVSDLNNGITEASGMDTIFLDRYNFTCTDLGPQSVVITAIDDNGNQGYATASVIVTDTFAPAAVAQDISVYLDANGQATITAAEVDNGSSDICGIDTLILDKYQLSCADIGTQSISLTAVDMGGNSSGAIANVTLIDTLAPAIDAQDLSIYLDHSGHASITASDLLVSVGDVCGMDTVVLDVYDFTCAEVGANRVQITAFDLYGNQAIDTVTVSVLDTLKPDVEAVDISVYLDALGQASISVADVDAGSSTACGIDSLYLDQYNFTCSEAGVNKVALMVWTTNGNMAADTALVTVIDSTKPDVLAQNINLYLDAAGQASVTAAQIDNGSSDVCGIDTLLLDIYDFSCAESGLNSITLTAVDFNGNSNAARADVNILDTINPMLNVQDVTVYLDELGQATLAFSDLVTAASDNCLLDTILLSKYQFGCGDAGTTIVDVTAVDFIGNTTSKSSEVTIVDTLNPEVTAQNITVYLNQNGQVSITAAEVDAGSGAACGMDTLLLDLYDFDCSHIGSNTVTLTGVKSNSNTAYDTAVVTVVDTLSPTLSVVDISVYLDANGQAAIGVSDLDPIISDGCGMSTATLDITSFSCADLGPNTVTLTGGDLHGNFTTTTATVTVYDTIAPTFNSNGTTVYLDALGNASISAADVSSGVADSCGIDTILLDVYDFDCLDSGVNTVTVTAVDVNGNTSQQQVSVTVLDTMAPVIATLDLDVYLGNTGEVAISVADILDSATEACGTDSLRLDTYHFDCSDIGANVVTLTAIDLFGNSSSATAMVNVMDTTASVVSNPEVEIYLNTSGTATIRDLDMSLYLNEACGLDTLYFNKEDFSCADTGRNSIVMTALDASGNIRTDSLIVTVKDTTPPSVATQNLTIYLDSTGSVSITPSDLNQQAGDACGIDTIYLDRYNFGCADLGPNTVTMTALDINGVAGSATAIITVADTIKPVVGARNVSVYLDAAGTATISVADVDAGSYDPNCSYTLSISDSIFDCGEVGQNQETLSIMDGAGNLRSVDFVVTVMDTLDPQPVLRNMMLSLNSNGQASLTADQLDSASTDNCASLLYFSADLTEFDCSHVGDNLVGVTVTDDQLNSITETVNVTVLDQLAPSVVTQDTAVYLDATGTATITPGYVTDGITDNCGVDSIWITMHTFTGADLGSNTIQLFAKDMSGNISGGNAVVTVMDTIKPIIAGQAIEIYLDESGVATFDPVAVVAATDNHAIATMHASRSNFSCADIGMDTVLVTALDFSGNSSSAAMFLHVLDTVAPKISTDSISLYLDSLGTANIVAADIDLSNSDSCGLDSFNISKSFFDCSDLGFHTVTVNATDGSGNTSGKSLVVRVLDTLAPSITEVSRHLIVEADSGACSTAVNFAMPLYGDNCGTPMSSSTHAPNDVFPVGTTTVQFTVQDVSGNTSTASFDITVIDKEPPVLSFVPENDTVGACDAFYHFAMPVAFDSCSNVTVTQIGGIPSGGYYPVGTTVNSFKLSDAAGNHITVSFSVTVESLDKPRLPDFVTLCENDDPLDIAQAPNMNWAGKGIQSGGIFDPAAAGPGWHQLTYIFLDDHGCITSDSMMVIVSPRPVQPVVRRVGLFTLRTGTYDSYQWYRNGEPIPGATSQTYSYTTGGNYQVMVRNAASCQTYSEGKVIGTSDGGIGLEEKALTNISIYPNPSRGIITLELAALAREELEVKVYSTTGQKVFGKRGFTEADGKMSLDLGQLPKATYMLHIVSDAEVVVRKIILH